MKPLLFAYSVTSIDPASRSSYEDTQDDAIINVTDDQWDCKFK